MGEQVNLGLTFYGGVSLAVFEAGIAYELVRAAQFSRIPDRPEGVPELHIDVVTGTSAGGLAAVQMAAALGGTNTEGVLAALVSMWANDADMRALMPAASFRGQGVLDNRRLSECVREVLEIAAQGSGEARLEDDLEAFLTLTNLSGLREPVVLAEDPNAPTFPTTRHVEYAHFRAEDVTNPGEWQRFVDAATITAGFPVAFPPLQRPSTAIEEGKRGAEQTHFVYVDGGLMDNRPLGVALDAIAEKPAPRRLFFFIDPNETWVPPSYGAADTGKRRLDPVGLSMKLGGVARSDSIFGDLNRIRGMYDDLAVLAPLARQVFTNEALRGELLEVYPEVLRRRFNPDAWALWLLIKDAVGEPVREQWRRVARQGRYALRARLHGLVDHLIETERLAETLAVPIRRAIDTAPEWRAYYAALRDLRALDKRFRYLKYRLWHEHFQHPGSAGQALPGPLQDEARQAFADLAEAAERLARVRDALARDLLHGEVLRDLDLSDQERTALTDLFYGYAQAMQVLESLAGHHSHPDLSIRRITPFDLYAEDADRKAVKPLAGGALGAFGGFLDPGWRINDFLVGRLVMRQQLRREGLIPPAAFARYRGWSSAQDAGVITRLAKDSPEARALAALSRIELPLAGLANDAAKPEALLTREDMAVGGLPATRIAPLVRGLLGSIRRLFGLNAERRGYRVLRFLLSPILRALEWLVWLVEQSLKRFPAKTGNTAMALGERLKWALPVLAGLLLILLLLM